MLRHVVLILVIEVAAGCASNSMRAAPAEPSTHSSFVGNALHLDGVDDQISLPVAVGGVNEATYSAEVWFRSTQPTGSMIEVFATARIGADRALYLREGRVCWYVYGNGAAMSEICTSAPAYADGAWHHAAGTLGPSGQRLYVDGELAAVAGPITRSDFTWDESLRAGFGYIGPNGAQVFFAGDLDELRVWKIERSADEISSNRASAIASTSEGLQAYWRLDGSDASGAIANSVDAYPGTLRGVSDLSSSWLPEGAF